MKKRTLSVRQRATGTLDPAYPVIVSLVFGVRLVARRVAAHLRARRQLSLGRRGRTGVAR